MLFYIVRRHQTHRSAAQRNVAWTWVTNLSKKLLIEGCLEGSWNFKDFFSFSSSSSFRLNLSARHSIQKKKKKGYWTVKKRFCFNWRSIRFDQREVKSTSQMVLYLLIKYCSLSCSGMNYWDYNRQYQISRMLSNFVLWQRQNCRLPSTFTEF